MPSFSLVVTLLPMVLATPRPGTSSTSSSGQVLARVDEVSITRGDLDERMRVLATAGRTPTALQAVSDLVDEALLASDARRLGLDREPTLVGELEVQRRRLAVAALTDSLDVKPTDALLRVMYHQTADTLRLVVVKFASREDAFAALARIKDGGDITAEARRSVDPRLAARGGDTGRVSRAAVDGPLADEAFRASPGDLIGPLELGLGWAIARVLERKVADDSDFAARRHGIEEFATRQLRAQVSAHLLDQLRRKAEVSLDEDFLRSVAPSGSPTEAELDHVIAVIDGIPLRFRTIHEGFSGAMPTRGHGAAAARIALAQKEIDRRLLEGEALARKLDRSPGVARLLPAIERNLLAAAAVERISGARGASLLDPAVKTRLDSLRAQAHVWIDKGAIDALDRAAR